MAQSFRKRN